VGTLVHLWLIRSVHQLHAPDINVDHARVVDRTQDREITNAAANGWKTLLQP